MNSQISASSLYKSLLEYYGPQGWWPLLSFHGKGTNPTNRGRLTGYHEGNFDLPTSESEIIEIMIGAILTQNTSWVNAEKAIWNLKKKNLLDIKNILKIDSEKLAEVIRSSGYYNQKAIKLKNLAEFLKDNSMKGLKNLKINELRTMLLGIKGIGPETADSIILYAFKKPIFVIDTYTKRLVTRLSLIDIELDKLTYNEVQSFFHKEIARDIKIYNEYHALIVQHCVNFCLKKPKCNECFLNDECIKNIKIIPKKTKKSTTTTIK